MAKGTCLENRKPEMVRGFKSYFLRQRSHRLVARTRDFQSRDMGSIPVGSATRAAVAQLAEHLICNHVVVGSIPTSGSISRG